MICDIHVHLAGIGTGKSGNFVAPCFRGNAINRLFLRRLGLSEKVARAANCDERIAQSVVENIESSQLSRAVLLAFDAVYQESGTRDAEHTLLVTDNDFVARTVATSKKVLFGASVHPYRRDALAELQRVIDLGARVIKWIPSAQNIQPDHPKCFPFYDMLARHNIPLLCHAGNEHTLKGFPSFLNDPTRLKPALDRGVTAIAAHCGVRLFLHEKSHLKAWKEMALRYERFYGDISAFGVITRIWLLRQLLRTPALASKLVYGSDFPNRPMPLTCLGAVSLGDALRTRQIANPFDQAVELMKAAQVPTSVFGRAGEILKL